MESALQDGIDLELSGNGDTASIEVDGDGLKLDFDFQDFMTLSSDVTFAPQSEMPTFEFLDAPQDVCAPLKKVKDCRKLAAKCMWKRKVLEKDDKGTCKYPTQPTRYPTVFSCSLFTKNTLAM